MKKEEFEDIVRKLKVFGFGKLQDLITLFEVLKREGISIEKVEEFVEFTLEAERVHRNRMKKYKENIQEQWNKNTRKCPVCKNPLFFSSVKTPKGSANVKGYTCLWHCSSEECKYENYTHENYKETYLRIMEGR